MQVRRLASQSVSPWVSSSQMICRYPRLGDKFRKEVSTLKALRKISFTSIQMAHTHKNTNTHTQTVSISGPVVVPLPRKKVPDPSGTSWNQQVSVEHTTHTQTHTHTHRTCQSVVTKKNGPLGTSSESAGGWQTQILPPHGPCSNGEGNLRCSKASSRATPEKGPNQIGSRSHPARMRPDLR